MLIMPVVYVCVDYTNINIMHITVVYMKYGDSEYTKATPYYYLVHIHC